MIKMYGNKKKLLLLDLLLEENEDEEILLECIFKEIVPVHDLFKTRTEEGFFQTLINRHLLQEEHKFRQFFRLNIDQFNYILNLIKEDLTKYSRNKYPQPISAEEKLAVTLRFMATGETFRSMQFAFRITYSYISIIVKETLAVLTRKLIPIFLPPLSHDEMKIKAEEFSQKWNFPNCIGAIDGKHIRIFCPSKTGSKHSNYKSFFSNVLLAIVDANYKFIFIDVGSYGKEGDSGIFDKSNIGKYFGSGNMFPAPSKPVNSDKILPYVIVGDEAFRLHTHMMKPFSRPLARVDNRKAIFNYRLSRARRVSENAFGLLSQIFRAFYTPIGLKEERIDHLIIAACCLHNFLRDEYLESQNKPHYEYDQSQSLPVENMIPLTRAGGFANKDGFVVRDLFTDYFNTNAGAVSWQQEYIRRAK